MIEHNKIHSHVIDIIKRYASEENPIDQNEILEKLLEEPDTQCERKTVTRALERLRADYGPDENGVWPNEDMRLHFITVDRSSSPIYKQYWFEINGDGLSDEELMFLMLAVQFSKHVSQSYADDIVKKLRNLSDNKYSSKFELFTVLNEKNYPIMKKFFMVLDDINRAIDKDKMISFYINEYGTDKKLHRSGEPIEVSPYKIVGSDGDLYLLCTKRDTKLLKGYRIDRISDVCELEENSQHPAEKSTARLRTNEYLSQHRYLYSGDAVEVTMLIDRTVLGDVIDSFGSKFEIEPADESSNRLTIHLKSCERDVIDWAMRYGEHAMIIEPVYLRNEIMDRAALLSRYYRDEETDIQYLEEIERARRRHKLFLVNTDLSCQGSYRHLEGIERVTLRHNGISDFSFLAGYDGLIDLSISNNEISDPSDLAELSELRLLDLGLTGITNLNFLTGMNKLTRLSLHEYSLEDVEAIYSLPSLKYLRVNNPVARLIDKRKLKRVYGSEFRYCIDDNNLHYSLRIRSNSLPSEDRVNDFLSLYSGEPEVFASCELTDVSLRTAICPFVNSGTRRVMSRDDMFNLIEEACDGNERRGLYENFAQYSSDEYVWHVTYEGGPGEQLTENDINRIYAISVFKHDHGLKLVALFQRASHYETDDATGQRTYSDKSYISIYVHIRYLIENNIGWAELGDRLETKFCRVCTINDVVNPAVLMNYNVFDGIEIDVDDYHYYRKIDGGRKKKKKIAYGHIELR